MSDAGSNCEPQERVLAEKRQTLGEDHPETLTAMLDHADCLWQQGRLIAARGIEGMSLPPAAGCWANSTRTH
jgi:hypothetical protein